MSSPTYTPAILDMAQVCPSPTNPRKTFDPEWIAELTESVKKQGVLQPILARPWPKHYGQEKIRPGTWPGEGLPGYEIVAGECRFTANRNAGYTEIPALVRDLTDEEVLYLQIIENLKRQDLHPLEEAEGYQAIMDLNGKTADELAEEIGKSRAYIYARLKLTALSPDVRKMFLANELSASVALLVARIPVKKLQVEAANKIVKGEWNNGPMSHREAQAYIQRNYMPRLTKDDVPFKLDEILVKTAHPRTHFPPCTTCPSRTGNCKDLYPEVKSADVCTDPACHIAKTTAWFKARANEGKVKVIRRDEALQLQNSQGDIKGLVILDEVRYDIAPDTETGKHLTNRQIIAKTLPNIEPTAIVETRNGAKEAVDQKLVAKAFEAVAGPETNTKIHAAIREETQRRQALHAAVREAFLKDLQAGGAVLGAEELKLVAKRFYSCLWHEYQKQLARLYYPDEYSTDTYRDLIAQLAASIDSMTSAELCLLLIDVALIGHVCVNADSYKEPHKALDDMARRLGIPPSSADKKAPLPSKAALAREETSAKLKAGDWAQVKDDALGPNGQLRKSCGRRGEVLAIQGDKVQLVMSEPNTATFWMPLADLVKCPAPEPTKAALAAVVYQHPDDPSLTWSGRGRPPKWVSLWLREADGRTLDDLSRGQASLANEKAIETNEKPTGAGSAAALIHTPRCTRTIDMFQSGEETGHAD